MDLAVTGFKGSLHFNQNWAARYQLHNKTLWGHEHSADVSGADKCIAKVRRELEVYPLDRTYNMDETGLFCCCIPNRAYVVEGQRKQARGTKAMRAEDRVTIVSACNATGTHKISIGHHRRGGTTSFIQEASRPVPAALFSQKEVWMACTLFKYRFETVFLPAVRVSTSQPVAHVSENCGAHEELQCDQVKFIALPPNCTTVYQRLDQGIMACLKTPCKKILLDLVVGAFESTTNAHPGAAAGSTGRTGAVAAAPKLPAQPTGRTAPTTGTSSLALASSAGIGVPPPAMAPGIDLEGAGDATHVVGEAEEPDEAEWGPTAEPLAPGMVAPAGGDSAPAVSSAGATVQPPLPGMRTFTSADGSGGPTNVESAVVAVAVAAVIEGARDDTTANALGPSTRPLAAGEFARAGDATEGAATRDTNQWLLADSLWPTADDQTSDDESDAASA